MKKYYYGACYYPELYPEERREEFICQDIQRMRAARFNVVRMAEFTWCLMEPKEGVFDFDWLERYVNQLGKNGIYTILCTPTASQPIWMARKYPQTLYVDNQGVRRSYGGRHYHCYNDPTFREFTDRICTELSRRFGNNAYVLGFQVDNEMGQEHSDRCQCTTCRSKFKTWLENRFSGDIAALNDAFGALFWGQRFDSFDQVEPPAAARASSYNDNIGWKGTSMPALRLAFDHFCSESLIDYFNLQKDALRRYSDKPVTHNTTHMGTNAIDYFELAKAMDVSAVDHYPDALATSKWDSGANYSMARCYHDEDFWLLETLCGGGHGNWAYQGMSHIHPGAFRQNMIYAYASGAEVITMFKYSVFPAGFEQLGSALIDLNRLPGRRYEEICQAGEDLEAMKDILAISRVRPEVAIVIDYSSLWIHRIKPINKDFDYSRYVRNLYRQLTELGINVDLIGTEHDFSNYKIVFLPFAPILPESFGRKCREYAAQGGNLVCLCMGFSRTAWGSGIFEPSPVGMTDFFGVCVVEEEPVFPGKTEAYVAMDDIRFQTCHWQETLKNFDAEVRGTFSNTYRAGLPVISVKRHGCGYAWYFGAVPTDRDASVLWQQLLNNCGVIPSPVQMWPGLDIVTRYSDRETFHFVFNSLDDEQPVSLIRISEKAGGDGKLEGNTLFLPGKGFAILRERP
ncbi:MAG: beta-galactosidase [Christensenellales bacterium]|jgi:beta-galactosidase